MASGFGAYKGEQERMKKEKSKKSKHKRREKKSKEEKGREEKRREEKGLMYVTVSYDQRLMGVRKKIRKPSKFMLLQNGLDSIDLLCCLLVFAGGSG